MILRKFLLLESLRERPVEEQLVELVERKGVGHPDSICDAIMEEISVVLGQAYKDTFGHYLHWNVDKALLVGGITKPKIGGGEVVSMNDLIRLIEEVSGRPIDVERSAAQAGDVVITSADITAAAEVLGYRPAVDLRAGLARQLAWQRD